MLLDLLLRYNWNINQLLINPYVSDNIFKQTGKE